MNILLIMILSLNLIVVSYSLYLDYKIRKIDRENAYWKEHFKEKAKQENLETEEQLLIRRVFNEIDKHHFKDFAAIENYIGRIEFSRSLGEDIANYMQSKSPVFAQKLFHKKRRYYEWVRKDEALKRSGK